MTNTTVERVVKIIREVFTGKGVTPPVITLETALDSGFGLESLDYAEMVVRLEEEFGADPFSASDVPQVRTVADLVALYGPVGG